MAELLDEFLRNFQTQFPGVLILTGDGDGLLGEGGSGWTVLHVLVTDAAGQEPVLVPSDPPLVQDEPGHEPGALQQEDAAEADGGVDTEGLESRHVLETTESHCED